MNPVEQGMNSEEGKLPHFECTKCGACCRDEYLLVTVTGSDIVKIAAVLGLGPDDMLKALDFYIMSDGVSAPVGLERIASVETERGLAFMALKKMENGDCVFLKEDLCMIHPVRPLVCRSFPFVFSDSDSQRNWGLSAKKEICPGLGVGPQVSESEIEELADTILPGVQIYKEFVKEWNETQTSPSVLGLITRILSDTRFFR
ncbi:MAG: YkgJ family cysteine cluster protein [Candidatus Thorarchaeota archaeon]|nr:MAG: YkgJ family cysteine cluster protein [Candidatus Thorarchaeota archaeon]